MKTLTAEMTVTVTFALADRCQKLLPLVCDAMHSRHVTDETFAAIANQYYETIRVHQAAGYGSLAWMRPEVIG